MAVHECDEGMVQHCHWRKEPANKKIKCDEVGGKALLMLLENKPVGSWQCGKK